MEKIKVANGGILVEEKNYRWEIKNFDIILKNENLLKMQKINIETDSNGIKSMSKFWFHYSAASTQRSDSDTQGDESQIRLQLRYVLLKKRGYCSKIDAAIEVTGEDAVGKKIFGVDSSNSREYANHRSRWVRWDITEDLDNSELIDGTLILRITLKLFTQVNPVFNEVEVPAADDVKIGEKRKQQFYRKISELVNDKNNSDVKIISSDGQEFFAYRWILSQVSDVFDAMFRSDMREKEAGVVKLNDLSGTTVKLLLHFIYTGKVEPQWSLPGIVDELAYAADRYLFEELQNYLDLNMGKICTIERAGDLLRLARKFSMEKAMANILMFIREKCKNAEDTLDLMN